MAQLQVLKALVNEDTFVAHDVSWATQTGKHLLRTQNVSEQNQKHFLCPQQMLRVRANGETFVSATMCPRLPRPLSPPSPYHYLFACS